MRMRDWEVVIGLETHVQLTTVSKCFSGAATVFGAEANRQACAVDLALPGTLPVMNRGAVERAIRFGLAVGAQINRRSVMARKNYFYPDLPKGYQISQYETPIVAGGGVWITLSDGTRKRVALTRAHLEEDAGKSVHDLFPDVSGVDLNRAGTPLLEIVTEPCLRSAEEAVAYARALHGLVRWLDICDGNMQEGSFRCDVNVSVRPSGTETLGTRREIKNLNSFRFIEQAIVSEVRWQIAELEDGRAIEQATVLFDPASGETRAMRSKEDAMDYRYFPDPDLPPLVIDAATIDALRAALPELPETRRARYVAEHGLPEYDASQLVGERALADYFDAAVAAGGPPKLVANWMLGELAAALNRAELGIERAPLLPTQLAGLIRRIADGTISHKIGKTIFEALWAGEGSDADQLIEARGLRQITDTDAIERLVDEVLARSATQIADYRAGKEKALMSIVGQVMKASQGKANPQQVNDIVRRRLGG